MCDDITELENQGFYERQYNRREFSLMGGGQMPLSTPKPVSIL